MKIKLLIVVLSQILLLNCVDLNWRNQLQIWGSCHKLKDDSKYNYGLRALPEVDITFWENEKMTIDLQVIADAYYEYCQIGDHRHEKNAAVLHRSWLRISGRMTEFRIGLQKINFGPAQIFRPLAWFDILDPHDPLEFTTGVEAALIRYYFLNNANIWLWGVRGKDDESRNTPYFSIQDYPEGGGRLQYPVPTGDLGISYHYRRISNPDREFMRTKEQRLGIDLRLDLEIGFWMEYCLLNISENPDLPRWTDNFTIGSDYTLAWANGLHFLLEHNHQGQSQKLFFSEDGTANQSALSFDYPWNIFQSTYVIFIYNWDSERWFRYLSHSLNFNYCSIYFNLFWNTSDEDETLQPSGTNSGKAVQIMVKYDF